MWEELDIDLERHDQLLGGLSQLYTNVYLLQKNRPKGMEYYDYVISEVHGLRIKELCDFRKKGNKVVAYFCLYVPEELVLASGAVLVGLCGGSNFADQDAEAVLPRNICPLIKASYGFKVARVCPYFQAADLLVGETTCDGKKKMFELLGELVPLHTVEVPQKPETEQARKLFFEELNTLKSKLEELTGSKITSEGLKKSIETVNAKRAILERLVNTRKASPPPISGKDSLLVFQIAFYDDPQRFTQKTTELVEELEERIRKGEGVVDAEAPRIMISGCPMAIPNWKLHNIVENSGAVIVVEESCVGTRYISMGQIDNSSDSVDGLIKSIADAYLNIHCSCFTPNDGRIKDNIQLAKDFKVDGVIHYSLQTCHGYNIEAKKVESALKEQGIPMLTIETDYSGEDTGQLTTRIEAFLEMLKK
ncbi:MAG: double-cubane-cluster-containing anaerobic reductase [Candidatus Freyrarchaeum guaymaensis]|nr:double-cubane-cluster-containing anaerobic reductase [Candidatus Sigynarchaeota archaeon]